MCIRDRARSAGADRAPPLRPRRPRRWRWGHLLLVKCPLGLEPRAVTVRVGPHPAPAPALSWRQLALARDGPPPWLNMRMLVRRLRVGAVASSHAARGGAIVLELGRSARRSALDNVEHDPSLSLVERDAHQPNSQHGTHLGELRPKATAGEVCRHIHIATQMLKEEPLGDVVLVVSLLEQTVQNVLDVDTRGVL
eukprot:7391869-Prymnesium_polylepis.1